MTTQIATTSLARLEHINLTVTDPDRTASMLVELFGWHVRWAGDSIHNGHTVHVGSDDDYLALYTMPDASPQDRTSYHTVAGLNHIAVVVDDLDAMEERVVTAGFEPTNHSDYEPGRRFYFRDQDNVEFEIVSYR